MVGKVTIHGEAASLLWAYRTAATLSAWKITQDAQTFKLAATVEKVDAFTVSQRPLLLEVRHGQGRSRWLLEELQIRDRSLTATLGPAVQ